MEVNNRITFANDESPGSEVAWNWVTAHSWPNWALDVVSVEKLPPRKSLPDPIDGELHDWDPENPHIPPVDCQFGEVHELTAINDPRLILGTRITSNLLVVGARGKGFLKALHLGSTSEWLLECPNTPLVIARTTTKTERIVVCIDGSSHSAAAVDVLLSLPWVGTTEIVVIAVVETDNDIREKAQAAADKLSSTGAKVSVRVILPDPQHITINPRIGIFEVLDEFEPELVVLGTRGLTGLPRLRLGSVASAIAHHAKCTVLLARDRSEDAEDL
jgi:nucleotide-binding universal stress UspA family protein